MVVKVVIIHLKSKLCLPLFSNGIKFDVCSYEYKQNLALSNNELKI